VSDYFLSDAHLRLDRPDRGRRVAKLVSRLDPEQDRLVIVGDLCDFWYQSRERRRGLGDDAGLHALRGFRDRGGRLEILLGNHDLWMGPDYEAMLGALIVPEPLRMESHGRRLWVEHGHRRAAVAPWKAAMETRGFLRVFEALPGVIANRLEVVLNSTNEARKHRTEAAHLERYREFARGLPRDIDLLVMGHVHHPVDESRLPTRLVVLGDWIDGECYLRVDERGVHHHAEHRDRPSSFMERA
jgi:UDP-2,3-diacylglucosamine hydrolase